MRATGATAQRARWCVLYCCFCALSGLGWDGRGRGRRRARVSSASRCRRCRCGCRLRCLKTGCGHCCHRRVVVASSGRVASHRLRYEDEAWASLSLSGRGRRRETATARCCRCRVVGARHQSSPEVREDKAWGSSLSLSSSGQGRWRETASARCRCRCVDVDVALSGRVAMSSSRGGRGRGGGRERGGVSNSLECDARIKRSRPRLYFVKVDVQACFDTIDQCGRREMCEDDLESN